MGLLILTISCLFYFLVAPNFLFRTRCIVLASWDVLFPLKEKWCIAEHAIASIHTLTNTHWCEWKWISSVLVLEPLRTPCTLGVRLKKSGLPLGRLVQFRNCQVETEPLQETWGTPSWHCHCFPCLFRLCFNLLILLRLAVASVTHHPNGCDWCPNNDSICLVYRWDASAFLKRCLGENSQRLALHKLCHRMDRGQNPYYLTHSSS